MTKIYLREEFGGVLFSVNGDKYTGKEWQTLCKDHKQITGEEYQI